MIKTIGIIAPHGLDEIIDIDFSIKIQSKYELTLENFNYLINNNFDTRKLDKSYNHHKKWIPAAGYYLSGLLRSYGYNTILTNNVSDFSLYKIADSDPIAICLSSTMITTYQQLKIIVNRIKEVMPKALLIVGGVFIWKSYIYINKLTEPTKDNNDINNVNKFFLFPCNKNDINADIFIVSPYGGDILKQLLIKIEHNNCNSFDDIYNITIPDNKGNFYFTKRIEEDVNINNEIIRWDFLDKLPDRLNIRSSVGCPYRCNFCDFCYIFPTIKMRSYESLLEEFTLIKNHSTFNNVSIIHFSDDNIFINEKRVTDMCNVINNSGIDRPWGGFIRSTSINNNNIQSIRDSGFQFSFIGVESGDQTLLNNMNRNQNINDMQNGIEILNKSDINVNMTFIVGYPGENERTLTNTVDFINKLDVNYELIYYNLFPFYYSPLSPLATSDINKSLKLKGFLNNWSHITMTSNQVFNACYTIFQNVKNVPYLYYGESLLFNMTIKEKLGELFQFRKDLTILIINKETDTKKNDIIYSMCKLFNIDINSQSVQFYDNLKEFINTLSVSSSLN